MHKIAVIARHSKGKQKRGSLSGIYLPQGGGANKPLISSAFKRGTSSMRRRSFNHLRARRLLTCNNKRRIQDNLILKLPTESAGEFPNHQEHEPPRSFKLVENGIEFGFRNYDGIENKEIHCKNVQITNNASI